MTNDEVVKILENHEDPFVTLKEVTGQLEVTKGTVHTRLQELADAGRVNRKKVGGRAVVWWLPERECENEP